jgi:serine/threonine protein kinase
MYRGPVASLTGIAFGGLKPAECKLSEIDHDWEQLPIAELHQFDALCDRFERAIAADPNARIETFIAELSQPQQRLLVGELLPLEIEHRHAAGVSPDPDEFALRFPQWACELRVLATQCLEELEQARIEGAETFEGNSGSHHTTETKKADLHRQWSDQWQDCSAAARSFGLPADGMLGHYQLQSVIGRGGMGLVVRAHDNRLDRDVAIKVLGPSVSGDATMHQRFLREARAAAAVRHPNVVTIYAVEIISDIPFLVMELVDGVTLDTYLQQARQLEKTEVVTLASQIALGLASAHRQGLIHRDVKPANILLERDTEDVAGEEPVFSWHVRIADFGLARIAADHNLTNSGVIAGTPQYMSPEQANGKEIDARSDLFSLGSVMYAMCAGEDAFRADSALGVLRQVADHPARPLRDLSPQTPDWLVETIETLMAKSPEDRFHSAADLARLLEQHLHDGQIDSSGVVLKKEVVESSPQDPVFVGSLAVLRTSAILDSACAPVTAPPLRRRWQLLVALPGVAIIAVIGFWFSQSDFRVAQSRGTFSEIPVGEDLNAATVDVTSALAAGKNPSKSDETAKSSESAMSDDPEEAFAWPAEDLWHGRIAGPDLSQSKELYRDDFDGNQTTWQIGRSAGYEYRLAQGSYFISADPGLVGGAWLADKMYANFACEVVGRVQVVNTQWFLNYTSATNGVTVRFHLNGLQGLEVSILNDGPPRVAQTIRHTAINLGAEFNKLLVVAVGNRFEIYVNDVAICNPIVLNEMTPPGRFALGAVANENPVRAEFRSFTIWSAERLPTLEERVAKGELHKTMPAEAKSKQVETPISAAPPVLAP